MQVQAPGCVLLLNEPGDPTSGFFMFLQGCFNVLQRGRVDLFKKAICGKSVTARGEISGQAFKQKL